MLSWSPLGGCACEAEPIATGAGSRHSPCPYTPIQCSNGSRKSPFRSVQSKIFSPFSSSGGSSSSTQPGKAKFGRFFRAHATPPSKPRRAIPFGTSCTHSFFLRGFSSHDGTRFTVFFDTWRHFPRPNPEFPDAVTCTLRPPHTDDHRNHFSSELLWQVQHPEMQEEKNNKTRTIDKKSSVFFLLFRWFLLSTPGSIRCCCCWLVSVFCLCLASLVRTQLSHTRPGPSSGRDFFLLHLRSLQQNFTSNLSKIRNSKLRKFHSPASF